MTKYLSKLPIYAIAITGLLATSGQGSMAADGFYSSLDVGYSFLHGSEIEGDIGGTSNDNGFVSVDDTYLLSASVGYNFKGPWRTGLEGSYQKFDVDQIKDNQDGTTASGSGDATLISLSINGYYDFEQENRAWTPYLGLGIGAVYADLNDISRPGRSTLNETGIAPAASLMAGVSYALSSSISLTAGYRLQFIPIFDGEHTRSDGTKAEAEADPILIHNVTIGVRFQF